MMMSVCFADSGASLTICFRAGCTPWILLVSKMSYHASERDESILLASATILTYGNYSNNIRISQIAHIKLSPACNLTPSGGIGYMLRSCYSNLGNHLHFTDSRGQAKMPTQMDADDQGF